MAVLLTVVGVIAALALVVRIVQQYEEGVLFGWGGW